MELSDNYKGHNLVFIVGCPRSGTTWLQRLLACHPKVHTGQESDVFDEYIGPQLRAWRRDLDPSTHGRGAIGLACYHREEEFLALLKEYMMKLLEPMIGDLKPGEIFLEKTPSHALFIPEIMELLPESRFIHIMRDARDVVASLLAASKSWGSYWAPKSAVSATRMWINHVQAVHESSKTLTANQFCEIRYENLHVSPLETLKGVSEFLKLQWDEKEMQNAIEQNRPEVAKKGGGTMISVGGEYSKKSDSFVREPEGFIRKARLSAWKEDLSFIDKSLVWIFGRKMMDKAGYHWLLPW